MTSVEFRRDRLGEVHVRGEAGHSGTSPEVIFFLPEDVRPKKLHAFPVLTGPNAGAFTPAAGMLLVYPNGAVAISSLPAGHNRVFIGEIEFRTDA